MGNNNSNQITINVNHDNLFYFTDEIISGTVNLNIIEENLEAKEISLNLIGEVGYSTTESITDSDGNSKPETHFHDIPFYSNKIPFMIPQYGQTQLIINQGKYSWPFQFQLSNHLPPTINQPEHYPHVRYYLQVMIDKSWHKRNQWERKYLTIYPHVNLLNNSQYLTSIGFDKQNKKQIKLKGTLNKFGYVPGESIDISLLIENPQQVLIKCINLSLVQFARLGEEMSQSQIFKITLPNIINFKDDLIKQTFSVMIPPGSFPPSYKFHGENQISDTVDISYMVKFKVKATGIFTDFDVDIPFTMGTEPNSCLSQQKRLESINISYPSHEKQVTLNDEDDFPPSYDSVQNSK